MEKLLNIPIFKLISEASDELGCEAYVIGGYVRDAILGKPTKDIDIVVVGSGIELAKTVAGKLGPGKKTHTFKRFGTAQIKHKGQEIEFVGARKESYRTDSRKPIVENASLMEDQQRRDFTINTMAIGLHRGGRGEFLDPFNGMNDLENRLLRTPLDPQVTFEDDPLRMIRAIRFATQLQFSIQEETLQAIIQKRDRISILSQERITDEINKILLSDRPSTGFVLLESTGMLATIFPELMMMKGVETRDQQAHKDNFYHTLKVLDNIVPETNDLWLRWAALLHDIAKPRTKRFEKSIGWTFYGHEFLGSKMVPGIFKRLRLPLNDRMKYVQKLVALHLRPIVLAEDKVTDSAVRRLLFDAGDDIDDLMTLCEADITSKSREKIRKYRKNFQQVRNKLKEIEEKDAIRNFQPPVSGNEIIEIFNIAPSEKVGIIKNAIKEAILDGKIRNDHEEAMAYMLEIAADLGLKPVSPGSNNS